MLGQPTAVDRGSIIRVQIILLTALDLSGCLKIRREGIRPVKQEIPGADDASELLSRFQNAPRELLPPEAATELVVVN